MLLLFIIFGFLAKVTLLYIDAHYSPTEFLPGTQQPREKLTYLTWDSHTHCWVPWFLRCCINSQVAASLPRLQIISLRTLCHYLNKPHAAPCWRHSFMLQQMLSLVMLKRASYMVSMLQAQLGSLSLHNAFLFYLLLIPEEKGIHSLLPKYCWAHCLIIAFQ